MSSAPISRIPTVFLRAVIVLIGAGVLAFLLWEPHVEGVNANATGLSEIYFDDPFLAYVYIASVAFFTALYQAFRLLGHAGNNALFSQESVRNLRTITYCAITLAVFAAGANFFIFSMRHIEEDIAGGIAMTLFVILFSVAVAVAAALAGRHVRKGIR